MSLAIGMGIGMPFGEILAFNPIAALFGAGEQGGLWNISLMSSLYQDSAGTTPVTAVEQPVGRVVDQSGRGNHLIQATSASRPTYSARYNLLAATEDFSNAAWSKILGVTVVGGQTDPDGGTTATRLVFPGTTNAERVDQVGSFSAVSAGSVKFEMWMKGSGQIRLSLYASTGPSIETIFTLTSTWTKYSVTNVFDGTSTGSVSARIIWRNSDIPPTDFMVWHPDTRRTIDTVGQPAYQRVTTSTDYDTTGFYPYLRCDGADDGMYSSAAINFSSSDEMSVFAGITKMNNTTSMLVELSGDVNGNAGSFYIVTGSHGSYNWTYASRGSGSIAYAGSSDSTAPVSAVFTGLSDISTDACSGRINGTAISQIAADQGSGNYGNFVLNVGRRNNSTIPLNGRIYSLIVRGATTSGTTLTNTERWIAQRMPGNLIA